MEYKSILKYLKVQKDDVSSLILALENYILPLISNDLFRLLIIKKFFVDSAHMSIVHWMNNLDYMSDRLFVLLKIPNNSRNW